MSEDDDTNGSLQSLDHYEFHQLFLVTLRLHAGRHGPVDEDTRVERDVNFDGAQFRAIAAGHARTCAGGALGVQEEMPATERLALALAALTTHIVFADVIADEELEQLYVAVVSDALASRNQHLLLWDDSESFPPTLLSARANGDQSPLQAWYRGHLAPQPEADLSAVIIGAMTDVEELKIEAVRSRAAAIKRVLERHGYSVHAPCVGPPTGRDPAVVVQDDVDKIARADLVIALLDPAAHGVGILLGEAARSHPAVIFVAEACTDITPLAAIVGDPDPTRITYVTDARMTSEIERALIRRSEFIRASSSRRRLREARSIETFDEYAQAYQFALDSGLALEVPDHPEYRVRLICTSVASFQAATRLELEAICRALNELLYGPETDDEPTSALRHAAPAQQESVVESSAAVAPRDDAEYLVDEWDQLPLFELFTRHSESTREELPPGWRSVNPLSDRELAFAEVANAFLELSDRDFRRMVHEAGVTRYREALAGAGVSRAHFGDAQAWVTFWRVHLGRP